MTTALRCDCSIGHCKHCVITAAFSYDCSIQLLLQHSAVTASSHCTAQGHCQHHIITAAAVGPEGAGPDRGSRQLVPQYDGLSNDCRCWQQLCLLGVPQRQHLPCIHAAMY